jgi:hypothetical protein
MPQAGRSDSVRLSHSDFGEHCEPIHGLVGSHEDMFWEEGSDLMIWPSCSARLPPPTMGSMHRPTSWLECS